MYIQTCTTEEEVVKTLETQGDIFVIKVFFSETRDLYYLVFENIEGDGELPIDVIPVEYDESSSENTDEYDDEEDEEYEDDDDDEEDEENTDKLNKMILYHLSRFENEPDSERIKCNRFDLESVLYDNYNDTYNDFKNRLIDIHKNKLIDNSKSERPRGMDNTLSYLFYETVSTYVIVSSTKKTWYYEDGIWKCSFDDSLLWILLSTAFVNLLKKEEDLYFYASYLEGFSSRKKILEDTKMKLLYQNFEKHIDGNNKIIGMKNGTLEIETGVHRDSRVSDLISKSTHIERISMDDRKKNMLMKILLKIFPDPDLLRFFIRSCSTFLEGYNSKKVFYVWWGNGNNGKTGMTSLVQNALGDYACTAPVSLITGRRTGASEASPELVHLEGKLVVFLQEPNAGEKLKTGRIKELTGNDKVYVRALYESPRDIEIKCKLVHVCNFPTAASNADAAFKRRVVVIKFNSIFVSKEEYRRHKNNGTLGDNIFKINETVDEILRDMGDVFLGMLVDEYKVFKEVGLQIPEIVKNSTQEFLTYNNLPLKYIRNNITKHNIPDVKLTSNDIYESFKYWFRTMYPSYNTPNCEAFTKELIDEGYIVEENGVVSNAVLSDRNVQIDIS